MKNFNEGLRVRVAEGIEGREASLAESKEGKNFLGTTRVGWEKYFLNLIQD